MNRSTSRWLLGLVLGGLLVGVYGCAGRGVAEGWVLWPFGVKSDHVPGIASPPEQVAEIRNAAEAASKAGADQQEQIARKWAAQLSDQSDPLLRLEIVRAASNFQTPTTGWILRTALQDAEADVRIAACRALGARRGPDAASALSEVVLSDVDADVRLAAVKALGQTGDRAATTALGKALDDRDAAMQYYAVDSLRKVTGQDYGNDLGRWRQYLAGQTPPQGPSQSVADRLRNVF